MLDVCSDLAQFADLSSLEDRFQALKSSPYDSVESLCKLLEECFCAIRGTVDLVQQSIFLASQGCKDGAFLNDLVSKLQRINLLEENVISPLAVRLARLSFCETEFFRFFEESVHDGLNAHPLGSSIPHTESRVQPTAIILAAAVLYCKNSIAACTRDTIIWLSQRPSCIAETVEDSGSAGSSITYTQTDALVYATRAVESSGRLAALMQHPSCSQLAHAGNASGPLSSLTLPWGKLIELYGKEAAGAAQLAKDYLTLGVLQSSSGQHSVSLRSAQWALVLVENALRSRLGGGGEGGGNTQADKVAMECQSAEAALLSLAVVCHYNIGREIGFLRAKEDDFEQHNSARDHYKCAYEIATQPSALSGKVCMSPDDDIVVALSNILGIRQSGVSSLQNRSRSGSPCAAQLNNRRGSLEISAGRFLKDEGSIKQPVSVRRRASCLPSVRSAADRAGAESYALLSASEVDTDAVPVIVCAVPPNADHSSRRVRDRATESSNVVMLRSIPRVGGDEFKELPFTAVSMGGMSADSMRGYIDAAEAAQAAADAVAGDVALAVPPPEPPETLPGGAIPLGLPRIGIPRRPVPPSSSLLVSARGAVQPIRPGGTAWSGFIHRKSFPEGSASSTSDQHGKKSARHMPGSRNGPSLGGGQVKCSTGKQQRKKRGPNILQQRANEALIARNELIELLSSSIQSNYLRRFKAAAKIQRWWHLFSARIETRRRRQIFLWTIYKKEKSAAACIISFLKTLVLRRRFLETRQISNRIVEARISLQRRQRAAALRILPALRRCVQRRRHRAALQRTLDLKTEAQLVRYDTAALIVQRWWRIAVTRRAERHREEAAQRVTAEAVALERRILYAAELIQRIWRGYFVRVHYADYVARKERWRKEWIYKIRDSIDTVRIFLQEIVAHRKKLAMQSEEYDHRSQQLLAAEEAAEARYLADRMAQRARVLLEARTRVTWDSTVRIQRAYRAHRCRRELRVLRAIARNANQARLLEEAQQHRAVIQLQRWYRLWYSKRAAERAARSRNVIKEIEIESFDVLKKLSHLSSSRKLAAVACIRRFAYARITVSVFELRQRRFIENLERRIHEGFVRIASRKISMELQEAAVVELRRDQAASIIARNFRFFQNRKATRARVLQQQCRQREIYCAILKLQAFARMVIVRKSPWHRNESELCRRRRAARKLAEKKEVWEELLYENFGNFFHRFQVLQNENRVALEAQECKRRRWLQDIVWPTYWRACRKVEDTHDYISKNENKSIVKNILNECSAIENHDRRSDYENDLYEEEL